jgi:hypothetical protein
VVLGLETLPCLTVGFSIDQYCNPWHVPLSAGFDILLAAQKDYAPLFQDARLPRRAEWFPLFCDAERDRDPGLERDIPVCFVGTQDPPLNPMRKPFLDAFRRGAPLLVRTGDFRPLFGRSRLVLNQCAVVELNFRIFEAMACARPCLTEDCENGRTTSSRRARSSSPTAGATPSARRPRRARHWRAGPGPTGPARARRRARPALQPGARQRSFPWPRPPCAGASRAGGANAGLVREETARAYAMMATDATLRLPESLRTHYAGWPCAWRPRRTPLRTSLAPPAALGHDADLAASTWRRPEPLTTESMPCTLCGKPAPQEILADIPRLLADYAAVRPDPDNPAQRVSFGTSGHRGVSSEGSFNEDHILAITRPTASTAPRRAFAARCS